jgi:hypothetical protein
VFLFMLKPDDAIGTLDGGTIVAVQLASRVIDASAHARFMNVAERHHRYEAKMAIASELCSVNLPHEFEFLAPALMRGSLIFRV